MNGTEFFIVARSFAAPFVSDESTHYLVAETAADALRGLAVSYSHPCGLYAAQAYASADDWHKGAAPLAQWLCNHEIAKRDATAGEGNYSYLSNGPGDFEVNGERIRVEDPKGGRVMASEVGRA